MSKLDFLKKIVAVGDEKAPRRVTAANRIPDGKSIRIYYDGRVYPSKELVRIFDLEYRKKLTPEEEAAHKEAKSLPDIGNALDVFDSEDFKAITTGGHRLLFINVVSRNEGGSDLFKTTNYDEDGNPSASVLDQAAATFGKNEMLPMLKEIYGVELNKETRPYVDLQVIGSDGEDAEKPFAMPEKRPVAFIPKKLSRGKAKGESTAVNRRAPRIYVLVVAEGEVSLDTDGEEELETAEVKSPSDLG